MQPYDIVNSPLDEGTCLIEAGAGTGKTYALTAIFLRLLFEKKLEPDRILVVTFTTAATADLRDRLRRQLLAIRHFLDRDGLLDPTLQAIVSRAGDRDQAREAVANALREFDRIAIFTIHGFCQRVLGELAFETDSPFELELLTDPSDLIQGIADDYWRRAFYAAAPELVDYALARLGGPETLAALYQRFNAPDLVLVPDMPDLPPIDLKPFRKRCAALRRQWSAARDDVAAMLLDPALNSTVYGSLKPIPGGAPDSTRRAQKIDGWCRALDHFLHREIAPLPLFPSLVYFTTAKMAAATRKGQKTPQHAFFDACQQLQMAAEKLQADLEHWLTGLRYHFFSFAEHKLGELKQTRQTLFYDDLLIRVARTLEGQGGDRLAHAVRRRYQAALVDEFQDTDSIQYAIFRRLFDMQGHLLFMIGDPKQAIYGFRGADIFSYLQAARQTHRKYTLVENWRSRPELIKAVNCLFASHPRPFLIPEIAYHAAVAAPRSQAATARAEGAAMIFWQVPPREGEGRGAKHPPTKKEFIARILSATAAEVKARLHPPADDPHAAAAWSAQDIAILTRTNRQARMVKDCMQAAGIPAVIYNAGSVFDTPEADDFERVMQAVVQPGDTRRLKTALATRFFGNQGDLLAFGEPGPAWWEEQQQRFFSYQLIWREKGFYPFFRRMLTENQVAARLLKLIDGERRLTNLLHLGELMQQTISARRIGPNDALKWLRDQRTQISGNRDNQQLRMESDARAITIVTIHKSKGLEFPIVFCPFSWESDHGRDDWPLFHDPSEGLRRTLYLGSDANTDYHDRAQIERRAEAVRLLYVAVTRACTRCYLVWGDLPGAETSALGYLLKGIPDAGAPRQMQTNRRTDEPAAAKADDGADSPLDPLARKAEGAIVVRPLPESNALPAIPEVPRVALGPARGLTRQFDRDWTIASFSSLIRAAPHGAEMPEDRDQWGTIAPPAPIGHEQGQAAEKLADDVHLIPRGAHTGNLFHRLFEILDYRQTAMHTWRSCVSAELVQFGFESEWLLPVTRLIRNVLATPLPSATAPFSLDQIAPAACIKELAFAFPLKHLRPQKLAAVFRQHDLPLASDDVDHQLRQLHFKISGGYLRGFIDLVFHIQGRYWLLDWKSNHLGDSYADYDPARIRSVMAADYYFLQYHLYTLALDQFLRLRLPGYAYEKDFGGVYYLFIRGMRPENEAGCGVYFDRPHPGLIAALHRLLIKGLP
ncbi:MAG: exodeoxyribonuclease V subunit beta [Desulfobacterales bacterium]|nr:exodeoxyribonuclease V subunit beta [Desulfobacterales bacterium]